VIIITLEDTVPLTYTVNSLTVMGQFSIRELRHQGQVIAIYALDNAAVQ
jgi:hypothetical protein